MGMSASQARFLGLTARQSNVEYEGQQINQQRTTLANESAGLFNQMISLQVPVPPSATDFYSMAYTFKASDKEEWRITNWYASTRTDLGAYDVDIKTTINDAGAKTNLQISNGTKFIRTPGADGEDDTYSIQLPGAKEPVKLIKSNKDVYGLGEGETTKINDEIIAYKPSYTYVKNNQIYFITQEALDELFNGLATDTEQEVSVDDTNKDAAKESYYKSGNTTENITLQGVDFETDETGRFSKIIYQITDPETNAVSTVVKELEINEINDTKGYDEAMENYKYKKMVYDRTIDDINNRTAIIQHQDKNLELKLKQCDTEQEAIQTEKDAVKKVIDKNIEGSFKTFA